MKGRYQGLICFAYSVKSPHFRGKESVTLKNSHKGIATEHLLPGQHYNRLKCGTDTLTPITNDFETM